MAPLIIKEKQIDVQKIHAAFFQRAQNEGMVWFTKIYEFKIYDS